MSRVPRRVARTVLRGDRRSDAAILPATGYNAALLAELVGPRGCVLSIDIDGELVSVARKNLAVAGYQDRVEVLLADGATALAAAGSVDRVIATAAVQLGRLPYAWVEQTRPGGLILAPVRAELASGPLVRLQVGSDGVARGNAVQMRVGFMELRAQRTPGASWSALRWDDPAVEPVLTEVDPFTALLCEASRWAIAVSVPSCRYDLEKRTSERGHGVAWLLDPITGSWASVVPTTPRSENYLARQSGPRRLWDEAAAAYRWWDQQGQPLIEDWQWTVTPHRQRTTLG